jgi:HSP20 family protein
MEAHMTPLTRMAEPLTRPLNRIYQSLDELASEFFGNWPPPFSPQDLANRFGLDVEEKSNEVIVRADAPGYDADDFEIELRGDLLTIRAEHKQENGAREKDYTYATRRFYRSVTLPRGAQSENVSARYRNGVLEIHLPKNPEHRGKRIQVVSE